MNMDTLKYLIEYFDLKDFIANNHPLRLLGIFITMMVLLVLAHIVCSIIEKKIIKLTEHLKDDLHIFSRLDIKVLAKQTKANREMKTIRQKIFPGLIPAFSQR